MNANRFTTTKHYKCLVVCSRTKPNNATCLHEHMHRSVESKMYRTGIKANCDLYMYWFVVFVCMVSFLRLARWQSVVIVVGIVFIHSFSVCTVCLSVYLAQFTRNIFGSRTNSLYIILLFFSIIIWIWLRNVKRQVNESTCNFARLLVK